MPCEVESYSFQDSHVASTGATHAKHQPMSIHRPRSTGRASTAARGTHTARTATQSP